MPRRIDSIKYRWKESEGVRGHIEALDVTWLIGRVEQLEEDIEKLKPFVATFNESFGTNLVIGKGGKDESEG